MIATEGTLLGGRVRYAQPATGFRSGIEPVLLAAGIPARAGQLVLEAGSGAGAGLLCLAARVPGVIGMGIEIDPALVDMANANAAANERGEIGFVAGDIVGMGGQKTFDHAFANPPYHPAASTPSPSPARAVAKIAAPDLFGAWIGAMARQLRTGGTLSLIVPATAIPPCLAAMSAMGCGSCCLLPLWPRAGRKAKLAILQAVRGGRGAFQVLPGLILHEGAGFSAAAEAILRDGAPLEMHQAR